MSSSDRLNPQQLAMFIPAGELMDSQKYGIHAFEYEHWHGETTEGVQARKLEESKQPYQVPETDEKPHGGGIWNSLSGGSQINTPIKLVSRPDIKEQEDEELIHLREGHNPTGLIRDGMHRIAAAADIDPKMEVPVEWKRNVHWEHDRTGRPADPPPPEPEYDPLEGGLLWSKIDLPGGAYKVQREPDTNLWHPHHYDHGVDDWVKRERGMSEGETRKYIEDREGDFHKNPQGNIEG
jgi:hypothetical protein